MKTRLISRSQRGVSLGGLLVGCFILALVALLGMKVAPAYIEYGTIKKVVQAIIQDPAMRTASLSEVKLSFNKRAEIDTITVITADDLDISKENDNLVIGYAYTKKIPLFDNISIVIDFAGTAGK